ncbi:2-oxoacid:acceptor oxidoreductase family protein [Peptoniphilaceae bacterium SGI.137]
MWEFIFYSRGGQGAVTASKILARAVIRENRYAQAIPSYGQERKGAPVFTYARINDTEIETKSYVYKPNCVVCFDPELSVVGIDITKGKKDDCLLVVNSPEPVYTDDFKKVISCDASAITTELLGENTPPNIAMLGALAKATGCVSIDSLIIEVKDMIKGDKGEKNAEACRRAFEESK